MPAKTRVVLGWQQEFLAMKRKGFQDIECCQRAGVSLEKFKKAVDMDADFKADLDDANMVGAARVMW